MKASSEKIEGSQVVLNVEVDAEEMEEAVKKAYRRLGAKTTVPGFRKGKAPPEMLERYYGKEAFIEDAAEHLLPEVYDRAIDEQEVDAIAQPQIDVTQVNPLSFKATVPIRPTAELGDYHDIKLELEEVTVADEEVGEALERIRNAQTPWEPVDRPAQSGDLLAIDVTGTVEDKTVIDEKEAPYHLSPDPTNALPGFAEKLEGAEKGEERDFSLTLPEDRGDMGGKECSFRVVVHEVKVKNLPELDDDFAKGLGQDFETLEALREKIAAEIKARKEAEARSRLEESAIEALVGLTRTEFPEILVQNEADRLMEERERYFGDRERLRTYLESIKKTEEELRSELRPAAERVVVRSLVLHEFAAAEKTEVSPAEVDAEVEGMLQNASDESIRKAIDSPNTRETIRRNLYIKNAVDRLVEIATGVQASQTGEEEPATSQAKEEGDENGDAAE
jgi:trigger factor